MKPFFQRLRRTSIRVRLIGLVLVPIVGLSAFAVSRANDRHHTAVIARSVRADAALTSQLTQLSVVLDRELDVAAGFAQAREYGISASLISDFLNYDLQTSLEESRQALDEAFDGLESLRSDHIGGEELSPIDEVIALRTDIDQVLAGMVADENTAEQVEALHQQVIALLSQAVEEEIADLWTSQAGLEDAQELTAAIRTNEAAIDLVAAVRLDSRTLSFYILPAVRVEGVDPEVELAVADAQLQAALEELKRSVSPSTEAELDRMINSDGWIRQEKFRARLDRGEIGPVEILFDEEGSSLAEAIVLASLVYDTAVDRMAALTEFQAVANGQAVARADELAEAADADLRRAVVLAFLVVMVAVVGAITTARSILASLSRLTTRAQRISEGSFEPDAEDSVVPRDLRAVDAAFDDLTASLRAVDRQAGLLARGELDHAELDRTIAGPLGESIHGSVGKLRQLTEHLEYQANHDALTGLPNRAALLSALDRNLTGSVQSRVPCTVMLLDLDGFKQANDTLGHVIGDEVLCRVADRLRSRARGHLVGRLGGDEFMVIVEGGADLIDELAHRLLGAFTQPISSSAGTVWLSACIGMVQIQGPVWLSSSEVLQRVDVALYSGKSKGPGSLVVFDQRLHDAVLNQSALQARLRKALSDDELELHFQPVLSGDGRIGVEALLRWSPAGEAPIPPDVFIAAAEQSELILHIDEWVIDRACLQLAEWALNPELADISISINISGRHVSSNQLPDTLVEAMQRHGISADRLIIEVTETELIPSIEQSIGVLARIRALGIRLAIDDFGTGFASVAHLRRVQFDRIKIDRAFVSALDDPTERSIATLLVSLGADLDLEVVAEGVETAEQALWAIQAGCTHLQGYYFARPMPVADVAKVLPVLRGRLSGEFDEELRNISVSVTS